MKSEARLSEARFGRLPPSIDDPGVEEDMLGFKNSGWRGVADEEGKQSIQTMREKAKKPVQNPYAWPCSQKGGRILISFI